jgi:hypothetical protein
MLFLSTLAGLAGYESSAVAMLFFPQNKNKSEDVKNVSENTSAVIAIREFSSAEQKGELLLMVLEFPQNNTRY